MNACSIKSKGKTCIISFKNVQLIYVISDAIANEIFNLIKFQHIKVFKVLLLSNYFKHFALPRELIHTSFLLLIMLVIIILLNIFAPIFFYIIETILYSSFD